MILDPNNIFVVILRQPDSADLLGCKHIVSTREEAEQNKRECVEEMLQDDCYTRGELEEQLMVKTLAEVLDENLQGS